MDDQIPHGDVTYNYYSNHSEAAVEQCDWPLNVTWLSQQYPGLNNSSLADEGLEDLRCWCVDKSSYFQFCFIVDIFLVCPLSLAGLLGNCLSVIILQYDSSINYATSLLLSAIAVADNVYLVSCLVYQTGKAICYSAEACGPALRDFYPYIERVAWATAGLAMTTVSWLVVVVTLGRYCAICRPLDTLRLGRSRRVRKLVVGVILLAVIYNIPSYFEHQVVDLSNDCLCRTQAQLGYTSMRAHPFYFLVYKTGIYFLFRFLLPLVSLTFLNTRLVMILRRQRQQQTHNNNIQQQQQQRFHLFHQRRLHCRHHHHHHHHHQQQQQSISFTSASMSTTSPSTQRRVDCLRLRRCSRVADPSVTALVVSMVTLFLACQLPDFLLRIVGSVSHIAGVNIAAHTRPFALEYWNTATNALLTVNSSANCLVYCFSGRRFRQLLGQLLRGRRLRRDDAVPRPRWRSLMVRRPAIMTSSFGSHSSIRGGPQMTDDTSHVLTQ